MEDKRRYIGLGVTGIGPYIESLIGEDAAGKDSLGGVLTPESLIEAADQIGKVQKPAKNPWIELANGSKIENLCSEIMQPMKTRNPDTIVVKRPGHFYHNPYEYMQTLFDDYAAYAVPEPVIGPAVGSYTVMAQEEGTPGYVKFMAPYLDILYHNRPFDWNRLQLLEMRKKPENRYTVYPKWIDDWEYKSCLYLANRMKDKKRLAELYALLKDI